jgi:hypothetical protein
MPSKEYYEGRDMENNKLLHKHLMEVFQFNSIVSDGSTKTKGDIIALKDNKKIRLSLKNVSGKNTQIHLTTLKKLSEDLNIPNNVKSCLNYWLGTNDDLLFNFWSIDKQFTNYEFKHNRFTSKNIENWFDVEHWFNENTKSKIIPKLLIQRLKDDNNSEMLIWLNKLTKKIQVIDIPKLIDYISNECRWITMPKGTTLRCITPENKPILWLQMKGNRTDDGYNHNPQFHIVQNWPQDIIIYQNILILE